MSDILKFARIPIPQSQSPQVNDSGLPRPVLPALSLRTPFAIVDIGDKGFVKIIDADGGTVCGRVPVAAARMLVTGMNGYIDTLGRLTEAEEIMRVAHRELRRAKDSTFDAIARGRITEIFKPLDGYLYPGMMG